MTIDNETIRKVRAVFRLTLAEMGALLGVSESHLCRIEKNERTVRPDVQHRLIDEFALDADKLARVLAIYDEFTFGKEGTA